MSDIKVTTEDEMFTPSLRRSRARTLGPRGVQITDLKTQIVDEDYWRRSPSPFEDLMGEASAKTADNSYEGSKNFDSTVGTYDETFLQALDGIKSKPIQKSCRRSMRGKGIGSVNEITRQTEEEDLSGSSESEFHLAQEIAAKEEVDGKYENVGLQKENSEASKAFWVK